MSFSPKFGNAGVASVLALAGAMSIAGSASAQLQTADVGVNPTFVQTGPNTITSTGGFFSARAFFSGAGDYSGGTLTYPGAGSPVALIDEGYPTPELGHSDANGSFAALQAAYPAGDYTFSLNAGNQPATTAVITFAGDAYSNTPGLTAASFTGLQGLNAHTGYTVDFNGDTPNANANSAAIFFAITDATNNVVFSDVLSSSATAVYIPGGTLAAGQAYGFDLLYDDRIGSSANGVTLTQFYDTHTSGAFTTATGGVPEPAAWTMMILGLAGVGGALRRRTAGRAAPLVQA